MVFGEILLYSLSPPVIRSAGEKTYRKLTLSWMGDENFAEHSPPTRSSGATKFFRSAESILFILLSGRAPLCLTPPELFSGEIFYPFRRLNLSPARLSSDDVLCLTSGHVLPPYSASPPTMFYRRLICHHHAPPYGVLFLHQSQQPLPLLDPDWWQCTGSSASVSHPLQPLHVGVPDGFRVLCQLWTVQILDHIE